MFFQQLGCVGVCMHLLMCFPPLLCPLELALSRVRSLVGQVIQCSATGGTAPAMNRLLTPMLLKIVAVYLPFLPQYVCKVCPPLG